MNIWKPHVTVAAVIERAGRFLMVEESVEGRVVLNQPAGHLDPDEGLIEAVIRETREETGHLFRPEYLCGIYRWQLEEQGITYLRLSFCGQVEEPQGDYQLDTGIIRPLWLERSALLAEPQRLRSPLVMACIDDYLAGKRYSLDMINNL